MIAHFFKLEWKSYFRSSHWQKSIILNVFLILIALFFAINFLFLGFKGFSILKKVFPNSDPLQVVNAVLIFVFLGDLIFRYLMQKLPIMHIKPLLILPIKKKKLIHYVLNKSVISPFNFLTLFFYIPFSFVLISKNYPLTGVFAWLITIIMITQSLNFLNFLINKNKFALISLLTVLTIVFGLQKLGVFNVTYFSAQLFNGIVANPIYTLISFVIVLILYQLNYYQLYKQIYLDKVVRNKVEEAKTANLSWVDKLGDVAPFIKNDIRLIWRNKRTKTVFLLSFLFLFYGLIFFTQDAYKEMPSFLIFASLFVTGGFTFNYGQFIPAWDSTHYKMLMSQNIRYRKFLESKWFLMVTMTSILYFLSIPYLYYGIDKFLMITAGAIFNIGFNSLFLMYAGSFNRKRIDLDRSGFGNTQGTSATQFLIMIPMMGLPMLFFWVFKTLINFNAGIIAIASIGILAMLFKKYFMNLIEKKYITNKYAMINAFEKEA